jgi:hypothetical protein
MEANQDANAIASSLKKEKKWIRLFAISFLVTEAKSTPFDSKKYEFDFFRNLGSKILLMVTQWPCKESKFDSIMAPRSRSWRKNKQHHSKELEKGFSVLFFLLQNCPGH